MKLKAIIFDTDGMVLNGELFSTQFARKYNLSYEKVLPFFTHELQQCLIGKSDLKKEIVKYFLTWGYQGSVAEFLEYWFDLEAKNLDPKMIEYIRSLKDRGIKNYLATNQEKYRTQYLLKNMGFEKIFDQIFISSKLGFKKPEKQFFKIMMRALNNFDLEEIIFFDDQEENVVAAKKFGLSAKRYVNFEDFKNFVEVRI